MIRILLPALWVCIVTLLSSYAAANWASVQETPKKDEPYLEGLEYRKTPTVTVPMIADGIVQGYVTAKFVFTADASTLRQLPIDPTAFVSSEAFKQVYVNGQVKLNQLQKYNLDDISKSIKINVNRRLNGEVIQDVLIDSINYIDKSDMRHPSAHPGVRATQPQPVALSGQVKVPSESPTESAE